MTFDQTSSRHFASQLSNAPSLRNSFRIVIRTWHDRQSLATFFT